jgi:hypothetical protein
MPDDRRKAPRRAARRHPGCRRRVAGWVRALALEVYPDDFTTFLKTPRDSLAGKSPTALPDRGDLEPVLAVLTELLLRLQRTRDRSSTTDQEGGRGGRTRTDDLVLPKHVRCQLRHTPPISGDA